MGISIAGSASYSQLFTQAAAARNSGNFAEELEISVEVSATVAVEEPDAQTVDDVKKEFYDYLDSLPIGPGLSRTALSVNITDAAFEKMLADPEYKQRMKDLCARDLCDPAWSKISPSAMNINIDADCEEEYLSTSWNHPDMGHKANSDGFWTRRTKNNQSARKVQEKRAQEKREMLQFLQEKADERKRLADGYGGISLSGTEQSIL